jgi:hypothetical protein
MEAAQGNPQQLRKLELALTWQLNLGADKGNGVIGGSIPNRLPVQPASMIYWTALSRWHILHPRQDGVVSSRGEVLNKIAAMAKATPGRHRTDDGESLEVAAQAVFASVPTAPPLFLKYGEAMDFKLTALERSFLRKHLIGVCRGTGSQSQQSLLALIADSRLSVKSVAAPWAGLVKDVADREDKDDFSSEHAQSIRTSLMGMLLPLMSRTERPVLLSGKYAAVSATALIDAELHTSDLAQFREMQECFNPTSREWIVPLWQSVPLPMQTLGRTLISGVVNLDTSESNFASMASRNDSSRPEP